jgi:two-component system response regulator NreC
LARGKRIQQILIADSHLLFRRGLKTIVSSEIDLEVIGEMSLLDETMEKANQSLPDVLLMDVSLLEAASDEQLVRLRQMQSAVSVLFLASADEPRGLELAMNAGGRGYMLKSATTSELLAGIRRVATGDQNEPQILSTTVSDLRALASSTERASRSPALTLREQEILRFLAEGHTVQQTAAELALSSKTIEAHKLNLMRKLDIHNRATLIEYAVKKGIVQPRLG